MSEATAAASRDNEPNSMAGRISAALLALLLAAVLAVAGGCSATGEEGETPAGGAEASDSEEAQADDGDGDSGDGEGDEGGEPEAVPVEVVVLDRGAIESVLRFSTNLEAENEVQVVSQAARQLLVQGLFVEEGDEVRKGQVLVRLQSDEQRTALARVEGQLAKARREYERQTRLFEQQLISEQVFNEATYELEQLELALDDAQRELAYSEVKAPISGRVTERLVSVGDQVAPGQRLFDLVDFDSIVARVYVPEKELWRVKPGLEARISAEARRGVERRGEVVRIAPRVDPRSGTVKVTVGIPREEGLLPGMYVSVELVTAVDPDALLVPKKAVVYDSDQLFIFRLKDDDRVERLLVEPRLEDRDHIQPAAGLEAGDRIVVAGQAALKDGSRVRVVGDEAVAPGEPAAAGEPS